MNALRLLPVILSFLLLAAHFYRSGQAVLAGLCLAALLLLFIRKKWVVWAYQTALVIGALEWLRTLFIFAQMRIAFDEPWTRLAIILGSVALFTALSALVFSSQSLRRRYGMIDPS